MILRGVCDREVSVIEVSVMERCLCWRGVCNGEVEVMEVSVIMERCL